MFFYFHPNSLYHYDPPITIGYISSALLLLQHSEKCSSFSTCHDFDGGLKTFFFLLLSPWFNSAENTHENAKDTNYLRRSKDYRTEIGQNKMISWNYLRILERYSETSLHLTTVSKSGFFFFASLVSLFFPRLSLFFVFVRVFSFITLNCTFLRND